jgi:uncharacterized integral membrane protein
MTHGPDGKHANPGHAEKQTTVSESDVDAFPPAALAKVAQPVKSRPTRVSGTWVAVIVALLLLIFMLIFILQNLDTATVYFLGASGSLPLGVAMLFSVIAGGLLVALVGGARILQLRKETRKARNDPH